MALSPAARSSAIWPVPSGELSSTMRMSASGTSWRRRPMMPGRASASLYVGTMTRVSATAGPGSYERGSEPAEAQQPREPFHPASDHGCRCHGVAERHVFEHDPGREGLQFDDGAAVWRDDRAGADGR